MKTSLRLIFVTCFYLHTLIASTAYAAEKLIFAIDIIRHGDRTPIYDIPAAPHQWTEGLGQLTAKGMSQEHELGHRMRQRYIHHYHLLNEKYTSSAVYVRSTDIDRTMMSAQSLLLGLFPLGSGPLLPNTEFALPGGYQPIPIHTVPRAMDNLLIPDLRNNFKQLVQDHVLSTAEWKEREAALQPKFAAWSAASGIDITSLTDLIGLGDSLYIYSLYHIPLPIDISAEDIDEIIKMKEWGMVTLFKDRIIGSATGGELLETVVDHLQKSIQDQSEQKWILFSAHDSTILAQLSALGTPMDKIPGYASDLNFSLFNINGQYVIRVTLNDKPVIIPNCGGFECTMEQLVELKNEVMDLRK